jgi:predicted nucleic acid-binding Zn ribbon protein
MAKRKSDINTRNADALSLGDAISQYLKYFKIEEKFNQTALLTHWEKIMGKTVASRTEQIYISKKILYLKINSAPLKNELALSKQKVLDLISKEIGEGVIEDIKIR